VSGALRALAIAASAFALVVCAAAPAGASAPTPPAAAAPVAAPAKPKQWLYVLRLAPRLHDDAAWTADDERVVGEHFRRLKQLTADGVVILAGRTTEPGDRTFGLVVFEAPDEASARAIMEADPTVKAGVMTATLHPYAVALLRAPAPAPAK
jgi:uncharacterized protein YciI